jgi:hypothetical protein
MNIIKIKFNNKLIHKKYHNKYRNGVAKKNNFYIINMFLIIKRKNFLGNPWLRRLKNSKKNNKKFKKLRKLKKRKKKKNNSHISLNFWIKNISIFIIFIEGYYNFCI